MDDKEESKEEIKEGEHFSVEDIKKVAEEEKYPKKKEFSILNEIKDDKNFKAFLGKFFELQKKCNQEE